jgi:hypothetical protein
MIFDILHKSYCEKIRHNKNNKINRHSSNLISIFSVAPTKVFHKSLPNIRYITNLPESGLFNTAALERFLELRRARN